MEPSEGTQGPMRSRKAGDGNTPGTIMETQAHRLRKALSQKNMQPVFKKEFYIPSAHIKHPFGDPPNFNSTQKEKNKIKQRKHKIHFPEKGLTSAHVWKGNLNHLFIHPFNNTYGDLTWATALKKTNSISALRKLIFAIQGRERADRQ